MKKSIVIVGGGVIGCITAIELKKKGFDITIIDKGQMAEGASSAAGGILFPLMPWNYNEEVYDLCKKSDEYYGALTDELLYETGINSEYKKSGLRIIAPLDKKIITKWAQENKVNVLWGKNNKTEELLISEVSQISPNKLMDALRKFLIKIGVEIIVNRKVNNFKINNTEISALYDDNQTSIQGDYYLITTGAWASELMPAFQNKVYPIRGQIIQYPKGFLDIDEIVYSNGTYVIQRADGAIIAGSTLEDVGFQPLQKKDKGDYMKDKVVKIFPQLEGVEIEKHWAGFRPGSFNNVPFIEKDRELSNLFYSVGHYRYGITMAPKSAERLTELIVNEAKA